MGLGFDRMRQSQAVAADVLALPFPLYGKKVMAILVMISALGAIHGMIFTGSRVYASLGAEHRVFAPLGKWHPSLGSPHWALFTQMIITLLMIWAVGTDGGRGWIDALLAHIGQNPLEWKNYNDGFDKLLASTAPVFWAFFVMTGLSFFVLRIRDARLERPFALAFPWSPLLPIIFCVTCLYMLYASVDYAKQLALVGLIVLLLGVPLYLVSNMLAAPGSGSPME
jgi:amino acid transporter